MANAQYRVGIIGRTGKGNYGHGLDTVWMDEPRARVVAVADENEKGREQAQARTGAQQAYADYREMLDREKLDIVAVCPRWIDQHHDMAIACADHGCHVFLEKPFCRNLEEADEIVRAFEMRHLKLAIAHQSRYSPVAETVRRLLAQGEIGDVLEIRTRGKEDARGGGEDLWVLGTHVLDLMRLFADDAVSCSARVWVRGRAARRSDVVPGNEGIGPLTGDHVQAVYELPGNVTGYFASRRGMGGNPSRFGVQIFGSKGVIEILSGYLVPAWLLRDPSWSPGRGGTKWLPVTSAGVDQPEPLKGQSKHRGNDRIVDDLLNAIEEDREPHGGARSALAATEMIAAVFESHRLGQPVGLPLQNRKNPLTMLES